MKTISKATCLFLLALNSATSMQSQTNPPAIEWQQSFGGIGSDECRVVRQTADGGYIVGGSSNSGISGNKSSPGFGSYDYWVVKTDGTGLKLWEKSFGGGSADILHGLQQTSDAATSLEAIPIREFQEPRPAPITEVLIFGW